MINTGVWHDCWNWGEWGLKEYKWKMSFLRWFVGSSCADIRDLILPACSGQPSTNYSFPHRTLFQSMCPHRPATRQCSRAGPLVSECTVIRFLWVSARFGTCTVVSVTGTPVEAKLCTFTLESTHFIFNLCPIYTHDGASAKFSTNSQETDYSVCVSDCAYERRQGKDNQSGAQDRSPL
jgi:hypothetical protein